MLSNLTINSVSTSSIQWQQLDSSEITTSVTQVEFDISTYWPEYDVLKFVATNIQVVTDSTDLRWALSDDGGTNWYSNDLDTNINNYRFIWASFRSDNGAPRWGASNNAYEMDWIATCGNDADACSNGWLTLRHWGNSSINTTYNSEGVGFESTSRPKISKVFGFANTAAAHDRIALHGGGNNIDSGNVVVYGHKRANT